MPFISFIIPVYNIRKFLPECIESITSQQFDDWEIILVDDKSTDGSSELCDQFAAADPRITSVNLPSNSGPGTARNWGLERATGDYVYFMDGDDAIALGELTALYEWTAECGYPDMMCVAYAEWFGNAIKDAPLALGDCGLVCADEFLKISTTGRTFGFFVWQFVFRRKMLLDHDLTFRAANVGEDIDFVIKCLCVADNIASYGKTFYHWRTRLSGSLSSSHIFYWDQLLKSATVLLDLLTDDRISSPRREWIRYNINYLIVQFEAIAAAVKPEDISHHKDLFLAIEKGLPHLMQFLGGSGLLQHIADSGAIRGASGFCGKKSDEAHALVQGREHNEMFVFPATRKSSCLLSVLDANGYRFRGMLDNDTNKQGLVMSGHTIFKPEIIPLCYGDNSNLFIIICTSTRRTGRVLADQLRSYGLEEGRHFVSTGFEME